MQKVNIDGVEHIHRATAPEINVDDQLRAVVRGTFTTRLAGDQINITRAEYVELYSILNDGVFTDGERTRRAADLLGVPFDVLCERKWRVNVVNSAPVEISESVRRHHLQEFGPVTWERLAAKLGEESGELCGAIVRDVEQRDGRRWTDEIKSEMRDVLTVLHVMAARLGLELTEVAQQAADEFNVRGFSNIKKAERRE